jgi:hypothetical protein
MTSFAFCLRHASRARELGRSPLSTSTKARLKRTSLTGIVRNRCVERAMKTLIAFKLIVRPDKKKPRSVWGDFLGAYSSL